ncbi:hypothetical protein EDB83DRAFT_2674131, partial [Lactarius deliciosus]
MMAMESSYTSRLVDLILEMASSFLSKRSLLPAPAAMPVHRKTYDTPHAPVLPPEPEPKFRPEHVPKYDIVSAPSPDTSTCAGFQRTFPSPSSPSLLNRRAACDIHGALPPRWRSGTRCSAHL